MNPGIIAHDIISILNKHEFGLDEENAKRAISKLSAYLINLNKYNLLSIFNEVDTENEIENHYIYFIETLKNKKSNFLDPRTELESALLQIDTVMTKMYEKSCFNRFEHYPASLVCAVIIMIDGKIGKWSSDTHFDNRSYHTVYNQRNLSLSAWNQLEIQLLQLLGLIDITYSPPVRNLMINRYKSYNAHDAHENLSTSLTWSP